jgi:ribosomal protein S18 acetylase RimI-like enzyme
MDVQFRGATADDVDAAVPLIYSSGPAAFEFVFADRKRGMAQDFLRYAFPKGGGEFGYRDHVMAVVDGKVVGSGMAFSTDTSFSYFIAAATAILGFYGFGAIGVIRRGLAIERIIELPKRGEHYIGHIGVTPELRSHGIGAMLMNHLLEEGKALGREKAVLDVSVENPRAQALYERLGFRVTREMESNLGNEFGKVVNHRRMELTL